LPEQSSRIVSGLGDARSIEDFVGESSRISPEHP
jgi:hypothetical protein